MRSQTKAFKEAVSNLTLENKLLKKKHDRGWGPCDREFMSWVATTKGIDAGLVGDLMMQAVEKRFGSHGQPPKTIEWLTDNGSCYTAADTRSFC
jgi:hypothetical protein